MKRVAYSPGLPAPRNPWTPRNGTLWKPRDDPLGSRFSPQIWPYGNKHIIFKWLCVFIYIYIWLVVLTCFNHLEKNSQWEGLSQLLWTMKNVWNHQPYIYIIYIYTGICKETWNIKWILQNSMFCENASPNDHLLKQINCIFLGFKTNNAYFHQLH